jgi:prevent-host-death family protein
MSISEPVTETLSQRELRNESGRVLREVSEGRSFVLTNSGVPVGRIVPIDAPAPALTIARTAKRAGGWASLAIQRKAATRRLAETLDDLRADRL